MVTEDWGHFEADGDEQLYEEVVEAAYDEASSSSDDGAGSGYGSVRSRASRASATSAASTTSSGLAELNSWLYDSCEMGVSAWMRAGDGVLGGRRRCYFTTGGDFGDVRADADVADADADAAVDNAAAAAAPASPPKRAAARQASSRSVASLPPQLWCVTPFAQKRISRFERLETALTPRLCPRVFSREFSGGHDDYVIVGASLGPVRVVRHVLLPLGGRRCDFLVMVSISDRCRRAWRSEAFFAAHAKRYWCTWSPQCRALWQATEAGKRWCASPACDDYPYVATRHCALEAVLREVLFAAESPEELLDLVAGDADAELPRLRTRSTDDGAAESDDGESSPAPAVAEPNDADDALLFGTVEAEAEAAACLRPLARWREESGCFGRSQSSPLTDASLAGAALADAAADKALAADRAHQRDAAEADPETPLAVALRLSPARPKSMHSLAFTEDAPLAKPDRRRFQSHV
ncbi:hypothetical protein M885DRAFT_508311 [Pelagophyceae sp. CCMP2097]|nr:hypothetical protein M885DRAFT_553491 [Pelagophyceae sp. CCMP2097]KAJ1444266.1 hypothetical protein M885DRAFT_553398 [Pelagophyceae sp. CCMP2097]KAJ1460859.1 hypothetical protein M885DRAFT_508311 [Pelagophyceae sp. CCMP2097]|eukprot:CAMPEP_0184257222 /NCGR_PEP_ID=MMETSP0977-20130417/9255_1 /TAXON_ID=483370 /ORGANISM="non described non described, Strain CCMP2097" /LENGTH=466 /DNA_ID=CAMNT_0026562827 /DNA_START=54 /DNA_END=1454 /DNA_ORIENTATION=+